MSSAVLSILLAAIAWIVPAAVRRRWREEWLAELQQVARARGRLAAVRLALGAAPDALSLRRVHSARAQSRGALLRGRFASFSSIDVKLAVRMLVRYPGLTIVGVIGMAVAITIVAGAFSIFYTLIDPALPLPDGDRIVAIQNVDIEKNRPERRTAHDVLRWRAELRTIENVGAFRQVSSNLLAEGVAAETVDVVQMHAAGFRTAGIGSLMGRPLADADEHPGAPPVVVVGYTAWQQRFNADPAIVGRTIQLGDTKYAVVGVMPEGFAFPLNDEFWVPLRLDASRFGEREGPSLTVFGKLAPGVTLTMAQAELRTLGARATADFPKTHAQLRPRVLPYTFPAFDIDDPQATWVVHLAQFLISLLLIIVCVNVAILVYARTARRHGEIAVRSALGASRGRIVCQLFVEALALSVTGAVAGLGLCAVALRYVNQLLDQMYGAKPFWWDFEVSTGVILYVAAMTVVAAAIIGILPALKATGRRVHSGLQGLSAGGGAGMRFGRTWTVLIVVQVAIAVALLPATVYHAWDALHYATADPGFAAREFLSTTVALDPGSRRITLADFERRYTGDVEEMLRRLREHPSVADVTAATSYAGGEATAVIDVDGVPLPSEGVNYNIPVGSRMGHLAHFNLVESSFFSMFDVRLLTGRSLTSADAAPGSSAVLVNAAFVKRFLGDQVLGRRIRYVGRSGDVIAGQITLDRWYEIVGVVADFPATTIEGVSPEKIYHAATIRQMQQVNLMVRARMEDASAFAPRLGEIAAAVDPNLQLHRVNTLDEKLRHEQSVMRLVAAVLAVLTASVMLLASAGIYSMMSFTVAQRRKEIGIRTALGADPVRILRAIFGRALWQMVAGAVLGVAIATLLEFATEGGLMNGNGPIILPVVALAIIAVGLLAVAGPARAGLRVHPTEALRQE
jgi:predicted permease